MFYSDLLKFCFVQYFSGNLGFMCRLRKQLSTNFASEMPPPVIPFPALHVTKLHLNWTLTSVGFRLYI